MAEKPESHALAQHVPRLLTRGRLPPTPAGSFAYWQAWLLIGILFIPMFIAGLIMMAKNPELLRKRLNAREKESQ